MTVSPNLLNPRRSISARSMNDYRPSKNTTVPKAPTTSTQPEVEIANTIFAKEVKEKDKNVWKPRGKSIKEVTDSLTWIKDYRLQSTDPKKKEKEKEPLMTQAQVDKSYKNLNKYINEKIDEWVDNMRDVETAVLESG